MPNFAADMTYDEYIQLKAFAKQDGALLALLWIGALFCYIKGLASPTLGMAALALILATPFFAAIRLKHFRDYGREGLISFSRGYAYTILIFFYGGLLLAIATYVYFAFMDNGYFLGQLTTLVNSEEGRLTMQMTGMKEQLGEGLRQLADMRPIDFALNMLAINITTGLLIGVPIAAIMQRSVITTKS